MVVSEIVSSDIFPLKVTDTCESALVFMQDWRVLHLPVVDNGKLLGYINFEKIAEAKSKEKIEKLIEPLTQFYIFKNAHFFELIKLFAESKYTCIAVCDSEQNYEGCVSLNEVMSFYKNSSISQPGAIITLLLNPQDYSLSELTRIIEYNDCKILNVFVHASAQFPDKIEVSLKLNKQEIAPVIQTLERYQYQIQQVHQASEQDADLNNRYDWLIKYLNT